MAQTTEFSYASPFSSMFVPRSLKSPIEDMLNQPNTKLEDLMEDEDFAFELKNCNPRLLEYFTKNPERIKQLLDYVIQVPPDLNDNKRAYQYPLIANEIFEADVTVIMNLFFNLPYRDTRSSAGNSPVRPPKDVASGSEPNSPEVNKDQANNTQEEKEPGLKPGDLLNHLFSFVNTKEELNTVLSGYFKTVVQKLLRRSQKKMIQFVYADEKILLGLLDHVGEFSIAELIPMLICYENYLFDDKNPEYLQIKYKVIEKIGDILKDTTKPEAMTHIGELLSEIMLKNETMADGKEIMGRILSKETFDILFGILKSGPPNSVILNIGNIIGVLLNQYTSKKIGFGAFGGFSPFLHISTDDSPIITSICDNIEVLSKLLAEEKQKEGVTVPFSQNTKPLGLGKLKVVEIVEKIMKLENRKIAAKISESGIIQLITDMFAKYIWNNMLHNTYERLFYTIIDKKDGTLLAALLEKSNLIQIIIKDIKEDQFQLPKNSRKVRKGHMGHLTKIANELVTLASMDKKADEYIKKHPEWDQVVIPALKAQNDLNNKEIGGCHPRIIQAQLLGEGVGYGPTPSLRDSQTGVTIGGFLSTTTNQADQQAQEYSPIHTKSPVPGGYISTESGPGGFSDVFSSLFAPTNGTTLAYDSFTVTSTSTDPVKPVETVAPVGDIKPFAEPMTSENRSLPVVTAVTEEKNISLPVVAAVSLPVVTAVIEEKKNISPTVSEVKAPEMREIKLELEVKNVIEPEKSSGAKDSVSTNNNNVPVPPQQNVGDKNLINNGVQVPNGKQDNKPYSIFKDNKYNEKEDVLATLKKSDSVPVISSVSPVEDKTMRNSLNNDAKSGKKMKLKLKKADKFDGNKILDMINQYKGANTSNASFEFSYSDNSQSECGNLVDEIEIQGPILEPNGIVSGFKN